MTPDMTPDITPDITPDPIIIALDFDNSAEADALVGRLGDSACIYKVGMELFAAAGPGYVGSLTGRGKQVFLDMKYHDIGETVKRAVAVAAKSGAAFLTVHGLGQVMRAAVEGRGSSAMKLIAITVLTSLDQQDLAEQGYSCAIPELVARRVEQAVAIGMDGVVASPLEARAIRTQAGPSAIIVTPGVRSRGAAAGDQKRVATPREAVESGADYLVIGRQVSRAQDPAAALAAIRTELS